MATVFEAPPEASTVVGRAAEPIASNVQFFAGLAARDSKVCWIANAGNTKAEVVCVAGCD